MGDFRFKQFTIQHDRCTMKVGTDAVLLGAWAKITSAKHVLDIGTGSGVIALMLAQRTSPLCTIDAVEIEPIDAQQATDNVLQSPWPNKVRVFNTSIQEFKPPHFYDLIISNPPYFINSEKPPDVRRQQTRHTSLLSFESLLSCVNRLLTPNGKFNIILPYTEGFQFVELARQSKLFCTRQVSFRTRLEKPIERWLLEFSRVESTSERDEILLYENGLMWSAKYHALTQEFYLNR